MFKKKVSILVKAVFPTLTMLYIPYKNILVHMQIFGSPKICNSLGGGWGDGGEKGCKKGFKNVDLYLHL